MKKSQEKLTISANQVSKKYGISRQTVLNKMKKLGVKTVNDEVLKECEKVAKQKKKTSKLVKDSSKEMDILNKKVDKSEEKPKISSSRDIKLAERLEKAKKRYEEIETYYKKLVNLQKKNSLFNSTNNGTAQSPILDKILKFAQLLNQTDETITKLEEKLGIEPIEEDSDPTKAPKEFLSV